MSGALTCITSGKATEAKVSLQGTGKFRGANLLTENMDVSVTGVESVSGIGSVLVEGDTSLSVLGVESIGAAGVVTISGDLINWHKASSPDDNDWEDLGSTSPTWEDATSADDVGWTETS